MNTMMTHTLLDASKSIGMQKVDHKKNFGLSPDKFNALANQLKNGDEAILKHIAKMHFQQCMAYLMTQCKVDKGTAYDLCLDTLLEFRKKLLLNKISYGNLNFLFTRMAKNAYVDQIKKKEKIQNAINLFTGSTDEYNSENENCMFCILEKSIKELGEPDGELIKKIYFSKKDIRKVAEDYDISYATLRKRKQRLLSRLKNLILDNLSKNQ